MRAALDETTPELPGGVAYVVAAAVVVADDATVEAALRDVLSEPGRTRPFHWHREGPAAKVRMIDCLIEVGAAAHVCVHHPTGRRRTEAARAAALKVVLPALVADGTSELVIESRGTREDERDRATILDVFHRLGGPPAFSYAWRPKAEPLLWLADGVCGATRGFLLQNGDAGFYDRLVEARVVVEPTYINDRWPRHA